MFFLSLSSINLLAVGKTSDFSLRPYQELRPMRGGVSRLSSTKILIKSLDQHHSTDRRAFFTKIKKTGIPKQCLFILSLHSPTACVLFLLKHQRPHTGEKLCECVACRKIFSEKSTLNQTSEDSFWGETP